MGNLAWADSEGGLLWRGLGLARRGSGLEMAWLGGVLVWGWLGLKTVSLSYLRHAVKLGVCVCLVGRWVLTV